MTASRGREAATAASYGRGLTTGVAGRSGRRVTGASDAGGTSGVAGSTPGTAPTSPARWPSSGEGGRSGLRVSVGSSLSLLASSFGCLEQ